MRRGHQQPSVGMIAAMAALSVADAVVLGKGAWQGLKHASTLSAKVQNFRRAPTELLLTFQLCGVLGDALAVAERLAIRHLAQSIVGNAVFLARSCLQECFALLGDGADADDDFDWQAWLKTGRKFDVLQRQQMRLQMAMGALQLALAAVSASTLPAGYARAPFTYVPAAFDLAHSKLQELEMGRTLTVRLGAGELWERGLQPSSDRTIQDALRQLSPNVQVALHCGLKALQAARSSKPAENSSEGCGEAEGDDDDDDDDDDGSTRDEGDAGGRQAPVREEEGLYLRFAYGVQDGATDDALEERVLRLDAAVRLRRVWSEELAAELGGSHGAAFLECAGSGVLCYEIRFRSSAAVAPPTASARPLVLTHFQLASSATHSTEAFSAEAFEAALWMALSTRRAPVQGQGELAAMAGGSSLVSVYDPDNPLPAVRTMQAAVGPLVGVPAAASGAPPAASDRNAHGSLATPPPVTPVRGSLDLR